MKTIPLGQTGLQASRLAYGCMRLDGETAKHAVMAAFDAGYTLFDHADIYGDGTCEALFGEVLRLIAELRLLGPPAPAGAA